MIERPRRAVRPQIDPEERKRRLRKVYTLLLDLAAKQEAAEQETVDNDLQAARHRRAGTQD